jgi:CheY-like chemotaxis protein
MQHGRRVMVDISIAIRTTLLLVDDDLIQLDLRALILTMSGFTVLRATGPLEAINILQQQPENRVGVIIIDYEMPGMNGCVLADYLRDRYPGMKILLHSGAVYIPENETRNIDAFVPKEDGVARLLEEVSWLAESREIPAEAIHA